LQGHLSRGVLIVVSDGGDNASALTFDDVLHEAAAARTTIYTIAVADRAGADARPERLQRLAEVTGGTAFRPRSTTEIERVMRQVARDIRHTYVLGYVPANPDPSTPFHHVRVDARRDGEWLRVRTRQGYAAADAR